MSWNDNCLQKSNSLAIILSLSRWQRIAMQLSLDVRTLKLDERPSSCNDVLLNMWNLWNDAWPNDVWMKEDDNGNDRDAVGWWQKHRIQLHAHTPFSVGWQISVTH